MLCNMNCHREQRTGLCRDRGILHRHFLKVLGQTCCITVIQLIQRHKMFPTAKDCFRGATGDLRQHFSPQKWLDMMAQMGGV